MEKKIKIPVYSIFARGYHTRIKPDFEKIGGEMDSVFKKRFLGQKVVIRCISSVDHKGKSVNDLIKIIKKIGTDRYDIKRKGDRYENIHNKKIDFFGLEFKIIKNSKIMEKFLEPFYAWPKAQGKKPSRLDLALVYERKEVKMVSHTYDGNRIKRDGFVFKNPGNKIASLKGIVRIK
jgi:hypothetical protein